METKARYVLIGFFTLTVMLGVFGFVYWLHSSGGLSQKAYYRVRFENSVSGLLIGSNVLFNGIKVGEITKLDLEPNDPHIVFATIAVDISTPIRSDTKVGMDFQGLTGAPVIVLRGNKPDSPMIASTNGELPLLIAPVNAGVTLTQSARDTLNRLDNMIAENSTAFHDTIDNIKTFTQALARNSDRVDGILAGLERMTGGTAGKPRTPIYSLNTPSDIPRCATLSDIQLVVPEPSAAMALNSDKFPIRGQLPDTHTYEAGVLADTVPALLQAKIIESLENAQCFKSVSRMIDGLQMDVQLIIDIRAFGLKADPNLKAEIDLSSKIIGKDGKVAGSQVFKSQKDLTSQDVVVAVDGLDEVFGKIVMELVPWVARISVMPSQSKQKN